MKITVRTSRNPNDQRNDPTFNITFGPREDYRGITLCKSELERVATNCRFAVLDCTTVVILSSWQIEVMRADSNTPRTAVIEPLDVTSAYVMPLDTRRFARRCLELREKLTPNKWDDVEFSFDLSRMQSRFEPKTTLGIMGILAKAKDPARLAKSILSFAGLDAHHRKRLMATLSDYAQNGELFGGGVGEINFRISGIYGGLILRGTEFSSHT